VKSCPTCIRVKKGREALQGEQRTNPVRNPFHTVHMDHFHFGSVTVLTMIDRATRWVEAAVVPDNGASTTAGAFLHHWVTRFGVPDTVVTDNDRSFVNEFLTDLHRLLGSKGVTSTVYHPQGNSPIESFHKLLRSELQALGLGVTLSQSHLDLILMAYRGSYHTGMHDTPAFLTYGTDLTFPNERDLRSTVCQANEERGALFAHARREILLESWRAATR